MRTLEELSNQEGAEQDPLRRTLPAATARRFTPPRFASEVTQGIRHGAAKLFKVRFLFVSDPMTAHST